MNPVVAIILGIVCLFGWGFLPHFTCSILFSIVLWSENQFANCVLIGFNFFSLLLSMAFYADKK